MKSVDLIGVYYEESEDLPLFAYDVELRDGEDFSGKFDVQFAAIEQDGEVRFAIVPRGHAPFSYPFDSGTKDLLDDLIDKREFVAAINYNNRDFQTPEGGYAQVMMGRDFGEDFDIVQHRTLDAEDIAALEDIYDVLREHNE